MHMTRWLLIASWALLLASCKEVSFPEPQPAGVQQLNEVPQALRGKYVGVNDQGTDTDTLVIESWGYHFRDTQDKDWLGKGVLNDSLVVKFYQNHYFVNFRSGDQWVLRVIRQKPGGAIDFLSIPVGDDAKRKEILKKLSKKFTVKEVQRKDDTFYQINPTREQLMKLLSEGFFTGNELTRIR
jgi:hypothetical protein